jgi:adenosylcobinamide-GDP ribazoletransferase
MNEFLAALRFLTVLPLPGARGTAPEHLAASAPFFPVIGLLLGILAAAAALGLSWLLPPWAATAALVIALLAFSGGLHMDGLSDAADGFMSARPRERILEIMKDSRIGAMGAMAIMCCLMMKFACLASLSREAFWRAALLMPLAGRSAIVIQMSVLPYARPEGGLASVFYRGRSFAPVLVATLLMAAAGWVLGGRAGIIAMGAVVAAQFLFNLLCRRRIGGATGDTLGASCEIAETVTVAALCAWSMRG